MSQRLRERPTRAGALGGFGWILGVGFFTLVPCILVVYFSYADAPGYRSEGAGFDGWQRMFDSPQTVKSMTMSVLLSLRVPVAAALAFLMAWALVRLDLPGKRVIEYGLWFAFFLPILPMTLGWTILADKNYGLLNDLSDKLIGVDDLFSIQSIAGIVWVHLTLSTVPIMTLLMRPAFERVDASYEEASDVAGASRMTSLRRITLPLVAPALLTSLVAGLIKSLEVFEVEQLLGVPVGIHVYSTRIYDLLRSTPPDFKQAMALSSLFLVVLLFAALLYQRALARSRGVSTMEARGGRAVMPDRTWRSWAVSILIFVALAISIVLPFATLVASSFTRLFGFFSIANPWTTDHWNTVLNDPLFTSAAQTSVVIAFVVALVGTLLFTLLAWVMARSNLWGTSVLGIITWLPWAVPGVLLGTAILSMFTSIPFLRPMVAGYVPLIIALLVMMMPLGTHMIRSSMEQVPIELEEASYLAGVGRARTFARITAPLLVPMFASVFMLVFMSCMKDISVTVLLARPGTRTLSLLMFEYAASGRMEPAAIIGVIMAAGALVMTVIMFRFTKNLSIG